MAANIIREKFAGKSRYKGVPASRRKMLCLVRMKACKRCGGDVSLECDIYGVYAECIQCGATWYQKAPKMEFVNNEGMSTKPEDTPLKVVSSKRR